MAGIYPMDETAFFKLRMITVQRKLFTKIIRQFDIHRIAMAGHRIARHCRCFIVRIKLDIETNIHHILKSFTHLTKGTRLNTISQVCWMRHFYSATNGCFIFDLVINHRVNCQFNSLSLDKTQ